MRRLMIVLALMTCPSLSDAQMYKCVDEKGVTHYTDGPRPGCKSKEVDIRPQPPISGALKPRGENLDSQEAQFRRRHGARLADEDRQRRRQLNSHCKSLRAEYARLRYINRRYASDDAFRQRLAQVEHQVKACK